MISNPNTKPLTSLLIKPTGSQCNLRCDYCFYLCKEALYPEVKKLRMSDEVLREMVSQAMEQSGNVISFGWQGGEPTMMGLPFFERALKYQQEFGGNKVVDNSLQTNGFMLGASWAEFFKKYKFLIGLSLDGPEHVHNRYRHKRGGQGTWKTVHEKASMLLSEGVEVNALCCVTDYSVRFPEEVYTYFKNLGFAWMQFIPIVEPDPENATRTAPFSLQAGEYGEFLISLFDLWIADFLDGGPTTSIRWFESLFFTYVDMTPPECTLKSECGDYLVVEHNGDVYSCDFFVEPKWKLGNVMGHKLIDMLNSDKQNRFGKIKAELHKSCISCPWLKHCYCGCPKDRLVPAKPTVLCEAYKRFFEHADSRLKQLAVEYRNNQ